MSTYLPTPKERVTAEEVAEIRRAVARSHAEIERLKARGEWESKIPEIRAIYAAAGWHLGTAIRLVRDQYGVTYRTAEIWLDEAIHHLDRRPS